MHVYPPTTSKFSSRLPRGLVNTLVRIGQQQQQQQNKQTNKQPAKVTESLLLYLTTVNSPWMWLLPLENLEIVPPMKRGPTNSKGSIYKG